MSRTHFNIQHRFVICETKELTQNQKKKIKINRRKRKIRCADECSGHEIHSSFQPTRDGDDSFASI